MDEAGRVRKCNPVADSPEHGFHLVPRSPRPDPDVERVAGYEVEHEAERAADAEHVVDATEVRVLEAGLDAAFFHESFGQIGTQRAEELERPANAEVAVTDGAGDYTVHRVWGVDAGGAIYRIDGWRGQATSDVWIEKKLDLIAKYRPMAWFGESGVIRRAIEPMLARRMAERRIYCRLEWLASIGDKPSRARSFQAMAASGRVFFEPGADLSEFLVFPAGKHDDDVDTAGMIGRALDQAHPAIVPDAYDEDEDDDRGRDRYTGY